MIGRDLHVAGHTFTAGNALRMPSIPVMLAPHRVAVLSAHTPLGHGLGLAMAGEVMHSHTELCVLRTPLVLSPAIAAVIVRGVLTGEAFKASGERSCICRWYDVVEVDVVAFTLVTRG